MSKAALILVGLFAAGALGLAVKDADAKPAHPRPPTQDDPDAEDGEVQETPDLPPQPEDGGPGPSPGAGSGAPAMRSTQPGSPRAELIPTEVRNVNLSGHEVYEYQGISSFGRRTQDGVTNFDFDTWMIFNSLNGMDIVVYRSVVNPNDWISMFIKVDPIGSDPAFHYIVHKVSDGPNKDWMLLNLAKVSHL